MYGDEWKWRWSDDGHDALEMEGERAN